jgi:hypothetical protein
VSFLLETGTSCHSRVTGFTTGFWWGPCWRQGLLAIQGRLGSLQVFGGVLVGDRDLLPFKGDWVHSRFLVSFLLLIILVFCVVCFALFVFILCLVSQCCQFLSIVNS